MKTIKILFLTMLLAANLPAQTNTNAVLSATVYPGYVFSSTEPITASKLNRLGRPTMRVTGTLSGSSAIGTNIIEGYHLSSAIVGLGTTNGLKFDNDDNLQLDVGDLAGPGLKVWPLYSTNSDQLTLNIDSNALAFDATGTNVTVNTNSLKATLGIQTFTSGSSNLVSGRQIHVAHGLSNTPALVRAVLVCQSTNLGYEAGDEVEVAALHDVTYTDYFPAYPGVTDYIDRSVLAAGANTTNVWVCGAFTALYLPNKSTGTNASVTATNWKVKVYCKP